MSIIGKLIKKTMCSENVEIWRRTEIQGARNSVSTVSDKINEQIVSIQATGSKNKVEGLTLQDNDSGAKINAVYVMYSKITNLLERDLVKRKDGVFYEVRSLEINGEGSPLAHMKSYLVKTDNQVEN